MARHLNGGVIVAVDLSKYKDTDKEYALRALLDACQQRMETMRGYRIPWWSYWSALAEMYFPQKYRFFVVQNSYARGTPLNQAIVDETGLLAARTLATGMLSGLTSPTKQWFRLGIAGLDDIPEGPVKNWLAECTDRMHMVYQGSNFYDMMGLGHHQNVVFGTACLIQYEDPKDVVRFYNPVCGEYFLGLDNRLAVDTLYREYTYTASEAAKEFGLDALSDSTRRLAKTAASLDTEIVIGHAIEPNLTIYEGGETECPYVVPKSFPYREVYWEKGGAGGGTQQHAHPLRVAGFKECPFVAFRWDVTSNDPYGRSPGMDALPAVRQLQIEQRRKAEAIDKMVRPPMVASVSMKNEPMDTLPGGVSFVADPAASGFKPAYTVNPNIGELKEDLLEVQNRVKAIFYNPLFTGISDMDKVQTATWVDNVREEKLVLIGPVIERVENEGLDQVIDRTFRIMQRRGLLPDPPPEIAGAPISIQYISLLAEAQRAASTTAIERIAQFTGGLVGVKPDVIDNLNWDMMVQEYGDQLNVDPEVFNSAKQVAAIRAARDQQMQAQAAMQVGAAAASGAKVLSETNVGGGQNALAAILGEAA